MSNTHFQHLITFVQGALHTLRNNDRLGRDLLRTCETGHFEVIKPLGHFLRRRVGEEEADLAMHSLRSCSDARQGITRRTPDSAYLCQIRQARLELGLRLSPERLGHNRPPTKEQPSRATSGEDTHNDNESVTIPHMQINRLTLSTPSARPSAAHSASRQRQKHKCTSTSRRSSVSP